MNIILVSNSKKRSFKLELRPFALCLAGCFLIAITGAIFYTGYQLASRQAFAIVSDAREQTRSIWQSDLDQQDEDLRSLKRTTERSMDTMAGRLSMLQGYVMRLDALGSRLATMADLDDIEFGVENPPGMGGSSLLDETGAPRSMPDLLASFDEMEYVLKDREEKLTAMESMLINRTLQEETSPGGRPSLGGYLSSLFGYRTDPMSGKREFHEGLDISGKTGSPVVAVAAGIVTWSGKHHGYGNLVEISHGNGYITRYAHNSKNLVSVGEKVKKGEAIAKMGSTGRSTGTHVHFEVIRNGKHVDPKKYLSQE